MSDRRLLRQQRVARKEKKFVQIGKAIAVVAVEPLEIMEALQPPGKEPQEDAKSCNWKPDRVWAVSGNRSKLCFSCCEIRWNQSNLRWEIPMERVLVAGKEGRLPFVQSGCTTGLGVVQPDCTVRQVAGR